MQTKAIITKIDKLWQVDWRDGENTIKTSVHSSKTRALAAIANQSTGITQFVILTKPKEELK